MARALPLIAPDSPAVKDFLVAKLHNQTRGIVSEAIVGIGELRVPKGELERVILRNRKP